MDEDVIATTCVDSLESEASDANQSALQSDKFSNEEENDENVLGNAPADDVEVLSVAPNFEISASISSCRNEFISHTYYYKIIVTETADGNNFNGNVTVKVPGATVNVFLTDGMGISETEIEVSSYGTRNAKVTYAGSDTYSPVDSETKQYSIVKSLTQLKEDMGGFLWSLTLNDDYMYQIIDENLAGGIEISRFMTIDGNGHRQF